MAEVKGTTGQRKSSRELPSLTAHFPKSDDLPALSRLETLSVEIQLNILRGLIPTNGASVYLTPHASEDFAANVSSYYNGADFAGITGIFRASKHL